MYGDGSLTETKTKKKNGTEYHYWVVRYYDNEGHRKAKRFPHTEQGKRDAKGFLRSIAQKKKDGVLVANTRTVASWVEEYVCTYKEKGLRDSSFERVMQSYHKIEASFLGSLPMEKLNGANVQRFYNMLAGEWIDETGKKQRKLSSSSISKIHKLLAAAYKKAAALRIISHNPMDTVDPVKVRTKKMSVFTTEEIENIYKAIEEFKSYKFNSSQRYDYRLLFQMLLETGCRVGELLALRWEDIDFDNERIHIYKTKSRYGQTMNDPKTEAGNRFVPILTLDLLARLKTYRNEGNVTKITGYLFPNKNGGAISYQRVLLTWKRICEISGINKNLHTFRHTAATFLLEKGVPVAEVGRILGHSDAATTYGMYVHSIPGYDEKIKEKFRQTGN